MSDATSLVDGDNVPVRHFGVVPVAAGMGSAGRRSSRPRRRSSSSSRTCASAASPASRRRCSSSIRSATRSSSRRSPIPIACSRSRPGGPRGYRAPTVPTIHAAAADRHRAPRARARRCRAKRWPRLTARALVAAEAQGLSSHGMSRVPQYALHLRNGRADGKAVPVDRQEQGRGASWSTPGSGLAFPACALAVAEALRRAREFGVAFAGVTNSHHFGVAAYHLLPVAEAGMVGLAFGNSPAAMPAAGGRRPLFGTNPIAAVFPRRAAPPLIIDLSLSEAARGKVMVAAREGTADSAGVGARSRRRCRRRMRRRRSTARCCRWAATKGAMLALVVELLACALTGAAFGFEADSFFVDEGNRPKLGQAFLVIDPDALAGRGVYLERVETLVAAMLEDPGVRLPGVRRDALAAAAARDGVALAPGAGGTLSRLAASSAELMRAARRRGVQLLECELAFAAFVDPDAVSCRNPNCALLHAGRLRTLGYQPCPRDRARRLRNTAAGNCGSRRRCLLRPAWRWPDRPGGPPRLARRNRPRSRRVTQISPFWKPHVLALDARRARALIDHPRAGDLLPGRTELLLVVPAFAGDAIGPGSSRRRAADALESRSHPGIPGSPRCRCSGIPMSALRCTASASAGPVSMPA